MLIALVELAIIVILIIAMWKIYEKAGQPGWAAIVPIYNYVVMLKIVGKPLWWLVMLLLPIVSLFFIGISLPLFSMVLMLSCIPTLIFSIWTANMLSKSFGKDEGFTVGLILLGFIFYPILGFGDATYQGPYGDKAAFEEYRRNKQGGGFDFEQNKLNS